jgi:glutamyl-tRNA reductase
MCLHLGSGHGLRPIDTVPLLTLGISHRTAPVDVRERMAFTEAQLPRALVEAHGRLPVTEMAILSTCNRTELYCVQRTHDAGPLLSWLSERHPLPGSDLADVTYQHWDREAALHTMRVASGLDSMVMGEPQILGQLKTAWAVAREQGTLGPGLNRLSQHAIAVAKDIRTHTEIGRHPVSAAYAAVQLSRQIFTDLGRSRAMMVGAGETIELVLRHLIRAGVRDFLLVNRTVSRAEALAERIDADVTIECVPLADLPSRLPEADLVITSTGSDLPVIGKGIVERALRQRRHRPQFMVDLAVPRDIETEVAQLRDIYLYTIDDLADIIRTNQKHRDAAAAAADSLLQTGADRFMADLKTRAGDGVLRELRDTIEAVRASALDEAMARLRAGESPEQLLEVMSKRLTNRLMHRPTVELRGALQQDDHELVRSVRRLFELSPRPEDRAEGGGGDRAGDGERRSDGAVLAAVGGREDRGSGGR